MEQAEKDPALFQFVVSIVIDRIFQRFKEELSSNFVKMKNFSYKGKNIRAQRVKVKKGPKIEEVLKDELGESQKDNDFLNNRNYAKEINKQVNENAKTPNWNFMIIKNDNIKIEEFQKIIFNPNFFLNRKFTFREFEENENGDLMFYDSSNATPKYGSGFFYLVELNLLAKSSGINLNICDDGFILTCGVIYKLLINFPYRIDSKKATSYFDPKNRYLYVFVSFYKDDIVKYKNENLKEIISENSKENNEIIRNEVKNNENVLVKINKEKVEDITSKIADDYLYDVIV